MDIIDLTTLRLGIILISVVCALVLVVVWRINRELPGVQQWLLGVVINSMAFLSGLGLSLGYISTFWFTIFTNTFSLMALMFMVEGSLRFRGFRSNHRWQLVFALVPLFIVLPIINMDDMSRRYVVHDTLAITMLLAAGLAMIWKTGREEFRVYLFSGVFSVVLALAFAGRSWYVVQTAAQPETDPWLINTVLYICILLYVIGWTYSLIAACYFKAHQNVLQMAREDSLTGLPNRRSIDETLKRTLSRANRNGKSFALIMLDLNRFKEINDSLGHAAGDFLLTEIGRRLKHFLREADFAGRLGGDEFLLILNDVADRQSGLGAVTRLNEAVAGPVQFQGRQLMVTLSIGLAIWPTDGETADSLLRTADRNMYLEKQNQQDGIHLVAKSAG